MIVEKPDLRLEWAHFKLERADLEPGAEKTDFSPEWADFSPERADFRQERADFKPERAYFRPNSCKSIRWSAVPVAKLCMIVNWSEGKQGSSLEGDKVL